MRHVLVFVVLVTCGCHYEPSICDSSPGSGCAECMAICDNDHGEGTSTVRECYERCNEGRWASGFR